MNGLAKGEPFTLSMRSSLRGQREREEVGIVGLKCAAEGGRVAGLPLVGAREGEGSLEGESGRGCVREKLGGLGVCAALKGLGEGARLGNRWLVRICGRVRSV